MNTKRALLALIVIWPCASLANITTDIASAAHSYAQCVDREGTSAKASHRSKGAELYKAAVNAKCADLRSSLETNVPLEERAEYMNAFDDAVSAALERRYKN